MSKTQEYHCLTCGDSLLRGKETPTFPFCSKRCKTIDLGRWFGGDYLISETLPYEDTDIWSESEPQP